MTQDLAARSLAAVWHPCTQMQVHESIPLLPLASGQGPWLIDTQGRRYLDGISSWWVNLFGHANPRITAAVHDQMQTLEHAMLAGCTHAPVVELSERLSALTEGALGHAFYGSDGASAIEIALKMSHHAWRNAGKPQKSEYVCVKGDYHGETVGALGVTDVSLFRDAYAPLLRASHVVPSPDWRQTLPSVSLESDQQTHAEQVAKWAAAQLETLLAERAGYIAAVIIEPMVQCATGMAMHHSSYLRLVRDLCDRYQVHFIADEIAVGFGRTGHFFACQHAGIWPDFLCLSKGITGGYLPLSAVLSRPDIFRQFYSSDIRRAFLHSHSYTGNPLACRAALATLDIFQQDEVLAQNQLAAARLSAMLEPLKSDPRIEHLRHCGMIWAFDVCRDAVPANQTAPFARRYAQAALECGALLRPIGQTVYLMPPYVLTDDDMALLVDAAVSALNKSCQ